MPLQSRHRSHADTCACYWCGAGLEGPPRDVAYQLPDFLFALPAAERAAHAWLDDDAAVWWSDGQTERRQFVRGLLPLPLADGDEFRFGVWLEVDETTWERVRAAWNDAAAYRGLRFQARLANAVGPWGEVTLGTSVVVGTREPSDRPFILDADAPWLAELLHDGWPRESFNAFARGLLQ